MKRHPYISLWCLLAIAFGIFTATSAMVDSPDGPSTLSVGSVSIKSSGIAHSLTRPMAEEAQAAAIADTISVMDVVAAEAAEAVSVDTAKQTVLFIGDSMLEGLSPRLADYCAANGHSLYSVVWYSSTSATWGQSDKLRDYISRIKPTFVFVSLGANELFVKDIKEKRRRYVQNIIADIGDIPYLWIGPPNWKPDTGINELVASEAPRGCYFKSDGMHFDRSSDGAHPTRKSAALWLDSIARWMPEHGAHPIMLNHPGEVKGKPRKLYVHSPQEQ